MLVGPATIIRILKAMIETGRHLLGNTPREQTVELDMINQSFRGIYAIDYYLADNGSKKILRWHSSYRLKSLPFQSRVQF